MDYFPLENIEKIPDNLVNRILTKPIKILVKTLV